MIKKLLLRGLILLLPFLVLLLFFLIKDPMKIVYSYESPVTPGVLMNDRLFQARHLQKTVNSAYNAFVFGSSRSRAFKTPVWKKYIQPSTPFHMGVNDETLFGLERKIDFLDSLGYKLNEVLIQIDHRLLSLTKDHTAHIFREYHSLTNETPASYYQRFFNAFLKPSFLKSYSNYSINRQIDDDGQNYLWNPGFTYNSATGDINYTRMDQAIALDSISFYEENASTFHPRESFVLGTLMTENAKSILHSIQQFFKKHNTNVRMIITPNYDQIQLNPKDVAYLQSLFGKNNVVDYSGVNEITEEIGNYYEHKHFKPYIATQLISNVYSQRN